MEGDVVVALLASAGTVLLGAQAQVLVAAALGDRVARRPAVLWHLWGRVDRTGTLIVPGLLALASGVAVGWAARLPSRVDELSTPRQVVIGITPALTALGVAVVALLLGPAADGATTGATAATTVATVALLQAALWAVPAPPLPAGLVVAALLPPERLARWTGLARGAQAPYGLAAGALLVVTDVGELIGRALAG